MMFESVEDMGKYRTYLGVAGVNAGDVLIETTDVARFNTFFLSNGAGACQVEVHDGVQWLTSPLALADLGSVTLEPVLVTEALRLFGWRGNCRKLRVRQSGATPATGVVLRCFIN